jgi:hypothetical protein
VGCISPGAPSFAQRRVGCTPYAFHTTVILSAAQRSRRTCTPARLTIAARTLSGTKRGRLSVLPGCPLLRAAKGEMYTVRIPHKLSS